MYLCVYVCRDLEASTEPVYSVRAHQEIINSLDGVGGLGVGEGAPEITTGSRDGEPSHAHYHYTTPLHNNTQIQ